MLLGSTRIIHTYIFICAVSVLQRLILHVAVTKSMGELIRSCERAPKRLIRIFRNKLILGPLPTLVS